MNFKKTIKEYKNKINKELEIVLENEFQQIKNRENEIALQLLKEYTLCGGKRLRPISLIMTYKSIHNIIKKKDIIRPSLSVEFLHTSSLIFDDLMDEDDFRRNNPGIQLKLKKKYLKYNKDVNYNGNIFSYKSKRYAASLSILIALLSDIFSRKVILESEFSNNKKTKIMNALNYTLKELVYGQVLDIEMEKNISPDEYKYLNMIYIKTARLYIGSLEIGGILADADKDQIEKLKEFGKNIALAFQIHDDIMDISSEFNKGHPIGSDIKQGKKTLLVIKAFEKSNKKQEQKLKNILGKKNASKNEIDQVIEIFNDTGSLEYCKKLANKNIQKAKLLLNKMKLNREGKEFFKELADYMVTRKI
jgi:geranylgeranyl diphosphate synthase type I